MRATIVIAGVIALSAALSSPATAATTPPAAWEGATVATGADAAKQEAVVLPNQYGVSGEYGYAFDPRRDISFMMARVFGIFDYGTIWHQDRPKALRFKVEGAVGSTIHPAGDFMASANMLALYYPGLRAKQSLRPYLEAGIGVIYTELRVKGQGLHFNFNPLLGVGCELPKPDGKNPFAAIRLHHLSNAGIVHDNRGVNSIELQVGRYF